MTNQLAAYAIVGTQLLPLKVRLLAKAFLDKSDQGFCPSPAGIARGPVRLARARVPAFARE